MKQTMLFLACVTMSAFCTENRTLGGKLSGFTANTKKGSLIDVSFEGDLAKEIFKNLKVDEQPRFAMGVKSFEKKGNHISCFRTEKQSSTQYSCAMNVDQSGNADPGMRYTE